MTTEYEPGAAENAAQSPRTVSRGQQIQKISFIGIDSLYLVVEYPHDDLFKFWSAEVTDFSDPRLHEGLPYAHGVLRRGGLGYKLSVWDEDARLFMTDRVNDTLAGTGAEGQGMGVMLQLGPLWLRKFGEIGGTFAPEMLKECALGELMFFGMLNPEQYPIRINRLDVTLDLLGLDGPTVCAYDWANQWVGYTRFRGNHFDTKTGDFEGLTVGTSAGGVSLRIYDKVRESRKRGKHTFWCSVWGLPEEHDQSVMRLEWSVRCYQARFVNLRYLSELTFDRFLALLNYVLLKWGQLREPLAEDVNRSRWPLAPLWAEVVHLVDEWSFHYDQVAERRYFFEPDISDVYLNALAGWLAGLLDRIAFDNGQSAPVTLDQGLAYLQLRGFGAGTIQEKAGKKWEIFSRLASRSLPPRPAGEEG